jgi:hypothetical protein
VYRRYLKIRLTACRCDALGDAWKWAHRHTENWMSGFVAIKYKREPIMLRYPSGPWPLCPCPREAL